MPASGAFVVFFLHFAYKVLSANKKAHRFINAGLSFICNKNQSITSVVVVVVRVTSVLLLLRPLNTANNISSNTTPPIAHTQGLLIQLAAADASGAVEVLECVTVVCDCVLSCAKAKKPDNKQKQKNVNL